jgi:hypothetical protein
MASRIAVVTVASRSERASACQSMALEYYAGLARGMRAAGIERIVCFLLLRQG